MSEIYDIAILGAGPAGISAVIYAARARLKILWLDKQFTVGGQIQNTYEVDNYPGLPGISGMDLGEAFENHVQKLGGLLCGRMCLQWKIQEQRRSSVRKRTNTEPEL